MIIYQIYQLVIIIIVGSCIALMSVRFDPPGAPDLVGGFPSKFVSSRISQNIFFHMIGNKSFHFIF